MKNNALRTVVNTEAVIKKVIFTGSGKTIGKTEDFLYQPDCE
jgi:hypothetical protein